MSNGFAFVRDVTLVHSSAQTYFVTTPEVQDGDMLIAAQWCLAKGWHSSFPNDGPKGAPGFSRLTYVGVSKVGSHELALWYRWVDNASSEPAQHTFSVQASVASPPVTIMASVAGLHRSQPILARVTSYHQEASGTRARLSSILSSLDNNLLMAFTGLYRTVGNAPNPFTYPLGWTDEGFAGIIENPWGHRGLSLTSRPVPVKGTVPGADITISPAALYRLTVLLLLRSANQKPFKPTLVTPRNGSVVNLEASPVFRWRFNDPDPSDRQSAWAFHRRKEGDSGDGEWWDNSGREWTESGAVWNTSTEQQVQFPEEEWENGERYGWEVRLKDSHGAESDWSDRWTVMGSDGPAVTVIAPDPLVPTLLPTIEWEVSGLTEQEGEAVVSLIRIFDPDTYGNPSFDPDVDTPVWEFTTGVPSMLREVTVDEPLVNGVTYQAYVQVTSTEALASAWAYTVFRPQISVPVPPTISAVADPEGDLVQLQAQAGVQGLPAPLADLSQLWDGAAGVSVTPDPEHARGHAVTAMVVEVQDDTEPCSVETPLEVPATGGESYTVAVSVKPLSGSLNLALQVDWGELDDPEDPESTVVYLDSDTGDPVACEHGEWTTLVLRVVAPSGTVAAAVRVLIDTPVDGDQAAITAPWFVQGDVRVHSDGWPEVWFRFERSDDGGATWHPVRNAVEVPADSDGFATVGDHEAPPNAAALWRARTFSMPDPFEGGSEADPNQKSDPSNVVSAFLPVRDIILKDFDAPTDRVFLRVQRLRELSTERMGRFLPLGASEAVHVSDAVGLDRVEMQLLFTSQQEYEAFDALRSRQRDLLLRWLDRQQRIRFVDERDAELTHEAGSWRRRVVTVTYDVKQWRYASEQEAAEPLEAEE